MKKTIITVAVLVAIALVGWWAYDLRRKKSAPEKKTVPLPPVATPPIQGVTTAPGDTVGGLYLPDQGSGKAAIEKRISDIEASDLVHAEIVPALNPTANLFKGLLSLAPQIGNAVSASTGGAGAENVPFALSSAQSAAITALAGVKRDSPGYWDTLKKLVNAATAVRTTTGVAIMPDEAYNAKDLNYVRNKFVALTEPPIGNPSGGTWTRQTEKTVADTAQFAKNWLALAENVKTAIRERAISDLRKSGWKFVGYDAPN